MLRVCVWRRGRQFKTSLSLCIHHLHSPTPLLYIFTADCSGATPIRDGSGSEADCHFDLKGEGDAKTECRITSISQRLSHGGKKTSLMFTKCLRKCWVSRRRTRTPCGRELEGKKEQATASLILYIKFFVIAGVCINPSGWSIQRFFFPLTGITRHMHMKLHRWRQTSNIHAHNLWYFMIGWFPISV